MKLSEKMQYQHCMNCDSTVAKFKLYPVLQLEFMNEDQLRAYPQAWLCLRIFLPALPICSLFFSLESREYTGDSNLLQWASKIQIQPEGGMFPAKRSHVKAPSNISLPKNNFGIHHLALCWFISAARGVFHLLINYLQDVFGKLHCSFSPWMHPTEICILVTCPHLSQW